MYSLTLTGSERRTIDWIGNRYAHGDQLYDVLRRCKYDPALAWTDDCDITFDIPEHKAWQISDIADASWHRWDCSGPALASKLEDFISKIV
jgi:hypothetical protein